jgi:hypothetical protein
MRSACAAIVRHFARLLVGLIRTKIVYLLRTATIGNIATVDPFSCNGEQAEKCHSRPTARARGRCPRPKPCSEMGFVFAAHTA